MTEPLSQGRRVATRFDNSAEASGATHRMVGAGGAVGRHVHGPAGQHRSQAVLQELAATRGVLTDPRFALENHVVVRHIDEATAVLEAHQSEPLMSEQEYHARRDS